MSSITPTYACFGCVEFAHNQRTLAYHEWACTTAKYPPSCVPRLGTWVCSCDADDGVFVDPVTDNVCWYDPLIPESADFLGVIVKRVGNLRSSTWNREMIDAVSVGSILQRPTVRGKQLVFELFLVATSNAGMDYGIEWLRRLFEDRNSCPNPTGECATCEGRNLTLRTQCPDESNDDVGLHTFMSAGTVDGVSLVEDDYPLGQRCCSVMRKFTLTIGTESPYSFSPLKDTCSTDAEEGFDRFSLCDDFAEATEEACCPFCFGLNGVSGCDACTTDPNCDCLPPFVLEPETIDRACFTDPSCACSTVMACCFDELPGIYDTALKIDIFSGFDLNNGSDFTTNGLRNGVIRIYENLNELPCPTDNDSLDDLKSTLAPCAEIAVSWIPPGATLSIDGVKESITLQCNGSCYDHSQRVFPYQSAGSIFPLVTRCKPLIVTFEVIELQGDVVTVGNMPTSMTVSTYRRFRL